MIGVTGQAFALDVNTDMQGAVTSVPAFARLDAEELSVLIDEISKETHAVAQSFRDGDAQALSMKTNIAVAR